MAIESWIDEVVKIAGSVKSHTSGQVKAYAVFKRAEIPEALSVFPCAITRIEGVRMSYSQGGPCIDLVDGVTEFHLFSDIKKANLPELTRYIGKIREAFAASMSLGGKVSHCMLRMNELNLELVQFTYGTEAEHHGILARWEVKENVTGQFTVGG